MNLLETILTSISVSADAFAVSICEGLNNNTKKQNLKLTLSFGLFQTVMPLIGIIIGITFKELIIKIDHWISFTLLTIIGANMIYDTLTNNKKEIKNNKILLLAISTSIDALVIGIAYYCAYNTVNIFRTFIIVGIITFIISNIGIKIGKYFGTKLNNKSQILGGIILIILAIKILLEHLK